MHAPPPTETPLQQDLAEARIAAGWHMAWGLGVAALLAVAAFGLVPVERMSQAGLAFALVPGLVGQALWRGAGPDLRLALGGVWAACIGVAELLAGGLSGPLSLWIAAPLLAGLVFGRGRERALGAAGSLIALALGLASALAMPAEPQPLLGALCGVLLIGSSGCALLWSLGRREGQEASEAARRARLERLLQALPLLALRIGAGGAVLAAFGRGQPGLSLDTLAADGLLGAFQPADRASVETALADAAQIGEGVARVAPALAVDRQLEIVARGLPAGEILVVIRDVSDQEAREAELEAARQEAETLHRGKTRFLANMSHELRTPLNAVLGFSDMMRQRMFGPLPERYLEYANLIHEAGGHLLDLINDVLDMSKIEAERFELARERFDAREPVSAALRLIRLQAHDKGVDLHAALPADPMAVEADKRALKQMTLNLLSNAVKFTPRHGSVTLTLEADGEVLELGVSDTGVGLSPSDLERIGKPYEQAGEPEQRARGTGLGLSLVRSLAELHGGRLTVESTLGEGSVFTLRLPVIDLAARPTGEVVPFPGPAGEPA